MPFLSPQDRAITDEIAPVDRETLDDDRKGTHWQPKFRQVHHRSIMRLHLRNLRPAEIAECVGLSLDQVYNIMRSDMYKAEMKALQGRANDKVIDGVVNVRRKIEQLSGQSIATLENLLEYTSSDRLKADIAFDLLDRAGFKPVEKREVVVDYATVLQRAYQRRSERNLDAKDATLVVTNAPNATELPAPEVKQYELVGFDPPSETASAENTSDDGASGG